MNEQRSLAGQHLTELILETFRLNGALLAAGDQLVAELGLTSARWQVLGAIMLSGRPLSVAQIARRMGLSRQAVQRVANDLAAARLVAYQANPDHKRAKLVAPTEPGAAAYAAADARQAVWVSGLAAGLEPAALAAASTLLRRLYERCRSAADDEDQANGP